MKIGHPARVKEPPGSDSDPSEVRGGYLDLLPGDTAVGALGDKFRTLLGSCISVILTDPRRTVGAMCHIVHVGRPGEADADNTAYGEPAMAAMFDGLRNRGITPNLCEAFLYGGGNMFPELFREQHVGATNADWVRATLQGHGIAVVEEQVGGHGYRKIAWTVGAYMPTVKFFASAQGDAHAG